MLTVRRAFPLAALLVLLLAGRAAGDEHPDAPTTPHLQLTTPMTLLRDDGATRRIPPGRFLDEPTWQALDLRFRELEDAKTRLTAENKSLRGALSSWQPGWGTLGIAVLSSLAAGWAAHRYLLD